jgi:hypothetical protein
MSDEGRNECKGEIKHKGKSLAVSCAGCDGPQALEERRCFMGLSSRLTPGFTGEVQLESVSVRRYQGAIIEALSTSAEIIDMIDSLGPARSGTFGPFGHHGRLARIRSEWDGRFRSDPRSILNMDPNERRALSSIHRPYDDSITHDLSRIQDRTRRMIARMEQGLK